MVQQSFASTLSVLIASFTISTCLTGCKPTVEPPTNSPRSAKDTAAGKKDSTKKFVSLIEQRGGKADVDAGRLTKADLADSEFTDQDIRTLSSCETLESLLLNNTAISDDSLPMIGALERLKSLDLRGTPVTGTGLEALRACKQLKVLKLSGSQIDDAAVQVLSQCDTLRVLGLDDTGITDIGLAHLIALKQLNELYLFGTRITDAGLEHVAGLSNLQRLRLRRTGISSRRRLSRATSTPPNPRSERNGGHRRRVRVTCQHCDSRTVESVVNEGDRRGTLPPCWPVQTDLAEP